MNTLLVHLAKPIQYPNFVDINCIREIADCTYRYVLTIPFVPNSDRKKGMLVVIMKNPSCASATVCDATIFRVSTVAKNNGYEGIIVMNLFPFRATNAHDVLQFYGNSDYAGKMTINANHLKQNCQGNDVVFAWGTDTIGGHRKFPNNYDNAIHSITQIVTKRICYIETNKPQKSKYPLHGLRWPYSAQVISY